MSSLVMREDTIAALATPPGRSALAVIRISGPDAHRIAAKILDRPLMQSRLAAWLRICDETGVPVDQAVAIRYAAPSSYTGEDAVEIICHGGYVTPSRVLELLVRSGARVALPGEFTRRAVMNGKLDLLQAEAINDLITAESRAAAQLAVEQMEGGLSRRIGELRSQTLDLEALMVYEIDFPEEDDGPIPDERIATSANDLMQALDALIATAPTGELVRSGAVVVISGPPNVGKSSLFNALIGRERAIVTETPGTTRDALEAVLDVSPIPLRIVDTAGIRDSLDVIEQMGVRIGKEYAARADVVLACGDSQKSLALAYETARSMSNAPVIRVRTKCDLKEEEHLAESEPSPRVEVSTVTGRGLATLVERIGCLLQNGDLTLGLDAPILAHARYREALERAREEVLQFRDARRVRRVPTAVAAVHLREAARMLEELIGAIEIEEVFGRVFSRFCVGK